MIEPWQQQQQLPKIASFTIIEQPRTRVRFRYATEGDNAGNIYGVSSSNLHQTFPTVEVSFMFCIDVMSLVLISIYTLCLQKMTLV